MKGLSLNSLVDCYLPYWNSMPVIHMYHTKGFLKRFVFCLNLFSLFCMVSTALYTFKSHILVTYRYVCKLGRHPFTMQWIDLYFSCSVELIRYSIKKMPRFVIIIGLLKLKRIRIYRFEVACIYEFVWVSTYVWPFIPFLQLFSKLWNTGLRITTLKSLSSL